jgi:hypothetical protein
LAKTKINGIEELKQDGYKMCYYSGKTKIDFHQKSKIWSYGEVPQQRVDLVVIAHIGEAQY